VVRRRLILRPGAIGDVIVSLPALEALRAEYTEIWTPSAVAPLVRCADRVRSLASSGIDLLELGRAPRLLLETLAGFDDIVSWYGENRPEFREAVRGLAFRFFPALPSDGGGGCASDFYLAQVGAPLGAAPRIGVPAAEPARSRLALHPYSGGARKNWPLHRYEELARREPRFIWCHELFEDLGVLAHWLTGVRLFVGNDSGVTHMAAAVGVPTVIALFGPTDPRVWAPPGAHVIQAHSLSALPVEAVHQAVIDLLK